VWCTHTYIFVGYHSQPSTTSRRVNLYTRQPVVTRSCTPITPNLSDANGQWRPIWLYIVVRTLSHHTRVTGDIAPRSWRISEELPFGLPCDGPPGRRVARTRARARAGHDPRGREKHPSPAAIPPRGLLYYCYWVYYYYYCDEYYDCERGHRALTCCFGRLLALEHLYNGSNSRSRRKTNRNRRRTRLTATTETLKHEIFTRDTSSVFDTRRGVINPSAADRGAHHVLHDRRVAAAVRASYSVYLIRRRLPAEL